MSQIDTTRSGNVIVPYVDAKKRTKQITLTTSSTLLGYTIIDAKGVFYADSMGNWRLSFNIGASISAGQTGGAVAITNVTFAGIYQAVSIANNLGIAYADYETSNIQVSFDGFGNLYGFIMLSGDVALKQEPTAYTIPANLEDVTAVDMFIAENSLSGSKLLDASTPMSKLSAYEEGSFTATGVGFSGSVTGTAHYVKIGKVVTLELPLLSGTSNATLFEITGLPSDIFPARYLEFAIPYYTDSSALGSGGAVAISMVGAISLYKAGYATWTASGTKAVPGGGAPWVLTYLST